MNLKNMKFVRYTFWTLYSITILLISISLYCDFKLKHIPLLLFVISFLMLFIIFRLRIEYEDLRKRNGQISKFGLKINFNFYSIIALAIGSLFLLGSIIDYFQNKHLSIQSIAGFGFILLGLENRKMFYLTINKKSIVKNNLEILRIKRLEFIEVFDSFIRIKTKNSKMEIFFNEINQEEKGELLTIINKLKSQINHLA